MRRSFAALFGAALLTAGCGYIGGPMVPLANVPMPVSDVAAVQRGSKLIVHFTVPVRTTENALIVKPLTLDLRVGTASEPFHAEEWAGQARQAGEIRISDGIATGEIPAAEWTGKEAIVGVRAIGANGKPAAWSNYAIVPVVPPPEVPANVTLESVVEGIRVTWTAPGKRFRVLRRAGTEESYSLLATVEQPDWTDPGTEYGKPYSYQVQTLLDMGNGKVAESDFSKPTDTLIPTDIFAPAAPSGLHALAAPGSIELNWERNTEPDLAGYRVYRAAGDGSFEKIADTNVPSYSDAAVEHGKQYRYAISALDKSGNQSARSEPVTSTMQ